MANYLPLVRLDKAAGDTSSARPEIHERLFRHLTSEESDLQNPLAAGRTNRGRSRCEVMRRTPQLREAGTRVSFGKLRRNLFWEYLLETRKESPSQKTFVSGGTGHRQELQHLITSRHYHAYCGKNASARLQEGHLAACFETKAMPCRPL
jgi:hypothetical protein